MRPGMSPGSRDPSPGFGGAVMSELSLLLSVAAFVYLVYAMLRPEKF
jgi:K+-transporting ATPase KdpF subunit